MIRKDFFINMIIFLISMFLILYGHRRTSLNNLFMMLVGLFLLLYFLYRYNKKY